MVIYFIRKFSFILNFKFLKYIKTNKIQLEEKKRKEETK